MDAKMIFMLGREAATTNVFTFILKEILMKREKNEIHEDKAKAFWKNLKNMFDT